MLYSITLGVGEGMRAAPMYGEKKRLSYLQRRFKRLENEMSILRQDLFR